MPGPPPKPPERRQRRNTPSLNLVVAPAAKPAKPDSAGIPEPSREWLAVTRDEWLSVWAGELATLAYNKSTDLNALYRLFGLRDDRERCRRAFRKEPLVEGSKGQPVANPLAGLIPGYDRDILALEDRFGLSPKARLMLGVTLGKAACSLDDLAGGAFDDEPVGNEEEDPRQAPIEARSRAKKV
jgi:P27 family predicted phage terminase small subunit